MSGAAVQLGEQHAVCVAPTVMIAVLVRCAGILQACTVSIKHFFLLTLCPAG